MINLLSVNTTFFTILNYDMSYIEFWGTFFTALSVYLAAKNKIMTWPIGIIGIILYGFLFYQIQLYSDLIEQFYYLVTGIWGWYLWKYPPKTNEVDKNNNELKISNTNINQNILILVITIIGTISLGYIISNIHLYLPQIFTIQASFPYLDAFTTILSFIANFLLMKRILSSWYLWIIVDIIGVGLYFAKDVPLLSILYFAFLINAIWGYLKWKKTLISYEKI